MATTTLGGDARSAGSAPILDEMVKAGPPADLVQALAVPLPGLLICELIGVPYADRDQFRDWIGAFMSVTALTTGQRGRHIAQLAGYLAPHPGLIHKLQREHRPTRGSERSGVDSQGFAVGRVGTAAGYYC